MFIANLKCQQTSPTYPQTSPLYHQRTPNIIKRALHICKNLSPSICITLGLVGDLKKGHSRRRSYLEIFGIL